MTEETSQQPETKATIDGFFFCWGQFGKTDIVQSDTESEAIVIFKAINGSDPTAVEPLTSHPYGRDVVVVVGESPVRKTWTER